MALFQTGNFRLASGEESDFKIECDVLDDEDWATIAHQLSLQVPPFVVAIGVPTGGLKLAEALNKYKAPRGKVLFADDVWTTGTSMKRFMAEAGLVEGDSAMIGAVAFARGPHPDWVHPLFKMPPIKWN